MEVSQRGLTCTLKGSVVFFKQQNTGLLSITKKGPQRSFQWPNEFHARVGNLDHNGQYLLVSLNLIGLSQDGG